MCGNRREIEQGHGDGVRGSEGGDKSCLEDGEKSRAPATTTIIIIIKVIVAVSPPPPTPGGRGTSPPWFRMLRYDPPMQMVAFLINNNKWRMQKLIYSLQMHQFS
ncbi:hypothetical protein U1Q18_018432 [Sarracenia purpurea var. burkii]